MTSPILSPRDLDVLIRERQGRLRAVPHPERVQTRAPMRAAIGRALIAAGTAVGGEQLSEQARPPASPASPPAGCSATVLSIPAA